VTSVSRPKRLPRSRERTVPTLWWVFAAAVVPLLGILAKIRIEGAEKLPREGAFVIAPNHYSEFDPLIVAAAIWRLGRQPRFMAKESLFRIPVVGLALRLTGMVPVARSSSAASAKQTLDTAEMLVERGRGIIVYPEGTLTRDPDLWPMRGKTGAVRLAMAGHIPLIPVAQWGTQEILPRYGKLSLWPLRKPVTVVIGDPVELAEYERDTPLHPHALAEGTDAVMDRLAEMLSELRNVPAPAERWNPSAHGQNETGRLDT
jgi:1-acyl-sn-glycerol-3-phosphate acyltransferase